MKKKYLLSLISFVFTLLFGFVYVFMYGLLILFSDDDTNFCSVLTKVSLLYYALLIIGVVLLTIFQFKKARGYFDYIYCSSLLASFLFPLFLIYYNGLTWENFHDYIFYGLILVAVNLVIGPAMLFLVSYFIVEYIKRREKKLHEGTNA